MQITRIKPGGWLIILLLLAGRPAATAGGNTGDLGGGAAGTGGAAQPGVLTPQQAEIDKFNAQSSSGKATLQLTESREAMQAIFNGKLQPTVWSPSSPVWTSRLAEYWPQTHGGAQIADPSSSSPPPPWWTCRPTTP